jgi:hypothetical protein
VRDYQIGGDADENSDNFGGIPGELNGRFKTGNTVKTEVPVMTLGSVLS